MPVVAVWIPAFRLAVAARGADLSAPLILADRVERGRVVDCTLSAAALGVRAGMTLVGSRAMLDEGIRVKVDLIVGLPGDTAGARST